jgi:Transcriptional regulator, AbiEi antitoxin, Type IV TA system
LLKILKTVKISKHEELELQAEQSLIACLRNVTFLKVLSVERPTDRADLGIDLLMRIDCAGTAADLVIEVKDNGQPRIARMAINQLYRLKSKIDKAHPVFIAPYISPQTAELCRQENVSYLDLAGNCHISFDFIHIHREGYPNPFIQKRSLKSLFWPKSARILRTLLCFPAKPWKLQELATLARVSLGQVANVKQELLGREWATETSAGLYLSYPQKLLAEWTNSYRYQDHKLYEFYSLQPIPDLEAALATVCDNLDCQYALTGFSGSIRLAPFVRYLKATAYVTGNIDNITQELRVKPVTSGANLTLIVPNDEGVFIGMQTIDGIKVASPIQLYLDLLSMHNRGEEAAQKLLEEVINPQWC